MKRLPGTTPGKGHKRRETGGRKQETPLQKSLKGAGKGFSLRKDPEEGNKRSEPAGIEVRESPQSSNFFPGDLGLGTKSGSV